MISVEVHPVDDMNVRDIASDLVSLTWSDGVAPPWHSVALTVRGPSWTRPVAIGDHIVIRLGPNLPAVAWAIVLDVGTSVSVTPDGTLNKSTWDIAAVGWFDYLNRVDLIVYPSLQEGTEAGGTVFGSSENPYNEVPNQFEVELQGALAGFPNLSTPTATTPRGPPPDGIAGVFDAVNNAISLNNVGMALDLFIRTVCRISIPQSLGGLSPVGPVAEAESTLRNCVRVIYDPPTSSALSGRGTVERVGQLGRIAEPVVGARANAQSVANGSFKIGAVIQGTWGADQLIVEMFPSLEDAGTGTATVNNTSATTFDAATTAAQMRAGLFTPHPIAESPPASTSGLLAGVAQSLGRNPVVVYRVRPWRSQPILSWLQSLQQQNAKFAFLAAQVSAAVGAIPSVQQVTWDVSRAVRMTPSDIVGMSIRATDDDVATLFTGQWLGLDTASQFDPTIGLPIFDNATLGFGGRLYTVSWPFGLGNNGSQPATDVSDAQQVALISAMAAQFGLRMQRFFSGTVTCRWRPDVRHGEPVSFEFPGRTLIGYCERVQHSIRIDKDGVASKRTAVTFSRGLWDEAERSYPYEPVLGDFNVRGAA